MHSNNNTVKKSIVYRQAAKCDIPGLKALWKSVFGDTDEYVDRFFLGVFPYSLGFLAECDGLIVGSAYSLPLGSLIYEDSRTPCSVVYSVATNPDYRGLGIAAELTNMAAKAYDGINTVCPAEDSLFGYYERIAGYKDFFYRSLLSYESAALPKNTPVTVTPLEYTEYGNLRETLLSGRTHIEFGGIFLKHQKLISKASGGDMYKITFGDHTYCCTTECYEGTVYVKEVLAPQDLIPEILSSLNELTPSEKFVVSTPCDRENGAFPMRSAMYLPSPECKLKTEDMPLPWFGFAFD